MILVLINERLKLMYKYLLSRIANCRTKVKFLNKLDIDRINVMRKAHFVATINIKMSKLKNH